MSFEEHITVWLVMGRVVATLAYMDLTAESLSAYKKRSVIALRARAYRDAPLDARASACTSALYTSLCIPERIRF